MTTRQAAALRGGPRDGEKDLFVDPGAPPRTLPGCCTTPDPQSRELLGVRERRCFGCGATNGEIDRYQLLAATRPPTYRWDPPIPRRARATPPTT